MLIFDPKIYSNKKLKIEVFYIRRKKFYSFQFDYQFKDLEASVLENICKI